MATFKIVNGPSKWDLMISLFHGGTRFDGELVMFEVEVEEGKTEKIFVAVTTLQRKPYDNTQWTFEGMCVVNKRCGTPERAQWLSHHFGGMTKGTFSTQTREGHLEFLPGKPVDISSEAVARVIQRVADETIPTGSELHSRITDEVEKLRKK